MGRARLDEGCRARRGSLNGAVPARGQTQTRKSVVGTGELAEGGRWPPSFSRAGADLQDALVSNCYSADKMSIIIHDTSISV